MLFQTSLPLHMLLPTLVAAFPIFASLANQYLPIFHSHLMHVTGASFNLGRDYFSLSCTLCIPLLMQFFIYSKVIEHL